MLLLLGNLLCMFSCQHYLCCPCCCANPGSVCCWQWPGVPGPIKPTNGGLKLFGGAAFERCLNEFQEAAVALKFPQGELGDATRELRLSME
jgi:hypothetical protein